jgi:hypothetical protein
VVIHDWPPLDALRNFPLVGNDAPSGFIEMEDRHRSRFMVRLPEAYHTQLMKLKKRTGKTIAAEVRAALEAYLAEHGLWPPPTELEE